MNKNQPDLSKEAFQQLLNILQARFEKNLRRHAGFAWASVEVKLVENEGKLWSLNEMEQSGGEPDVVGYDAETGEFIFFDCAKESPIGRRNACYDRAALESRKANKPNDTALDMAEAMGIELLSEAQYRALQELGEFDTKTSSWLKTPPEIRKLGGALFGDRRYEHVFIYHNGADSYYGARGFRGVLRV